MYSAAKKILSLVNKGYCIENNIPGMSIKLIWNFISGFKKSVSKETDLCDQKEGFGLRFKQKSLEGKVKYLSSLLFSAQDDGRRAKLCCQTQIIQD